MGKVRTGIVISNKSDKTAIVRVDRMVPHKKYGKRFRVSKNFAAHDEQNIAQIGDTFTIRECSPLSKTKTWELVEKVQAGETV
jgi:small subunit ribosomal protein S17